jgi:MerR family transcriptional regulator, heat shock protein HspR
MKRKKGFYSISVVAEMFEVHQQTIRMYEKEGLITPKRSEGNTRLFSEDDVNRLEEIIYLTHKMGVNLAGVEMILKLKKRVTKLQDELNSVIKNAQSQLDQDVEEYKKDVQRQASRLLDIKKDNMKRVEKKHIDVQDVSVSDSSQMQADNHDIAGKGGKQRLRSSQDFSGTVDQQEVDDWQIEYEDD